MEKTFSIMWRSWAASHADHQWTGEVMVGGTDVAMRATERERLDIL